MLAEKAESERIQRAPVVWSEHFSSLHKLSPWTRHSSAKGGKGSKGREKPDFLISIGVGADV